MSTVLTKPILIRSSILFAIGAILAYYTAIATPTGRADDPPKVVCFVMPDPCPTCMETMDVSQCPVNLEGWNWGYCDEYSDYHLPCYEHETTCQIKYNCDSPPEPFLDPILGLPIYCGDVLWDICVNQ